MLGSWEHTSPAQQLRLGGGVLEGAAEVLRVLGVRRALLVTTRGRLGSPGAGQLVEPLGRLLAATFDEVEPEVPAPSVQGAVALARREGIDGLVSFGGGSATDTAKAVAFFAEHEAGTPGSSFADRPLLPHVSVPTTLAGAAFTSSFSMFDPGTRRSSTSGAPSITPAAVLLAPELSAGMGLELLRSTIATALAHGIEAAWAPDRSPEAEVLALAGLRRIAREVAVGAAGLAEPARWPALLEGSVLCGRARQSAGDGLHHVLAQLLGARSGLGCGAAHAVLLAVTTRFTADAVPAAAERIAAALGAVGEAPGDLVASLLARLGGGERLGELGVDPEDLEAVARQAGSAPGVRRNPRPVGEADVRGLLEAAW